nr:LuxR C-terminal-related transcriptional regulator [Micromonospora sp. DSM 115978]
MSSVDIVVVTLADRDFIELVSDESGRFGPRVLVIVDELSHRNIGVLNSFSFDGMLLRDELSVQVLTDALDRLRAGQLLMPNSLARQLMARVAGSVGDHHARPPALTSRENETVALLGSGMSNKQIARALGISSHGAKRLVGSVLLKLGAPNRTAAVVSAIKAGIIAPD